MSEGLPCEAVEGRQLIPNRVHITIRFLCRKGPQMIREQILMLRIGALERVKHLAGPRSCQCRRVVSYKYLNGSRVALEDRHP
jgi:hypothetical protein